MSKDVETTDIEEQSNDAIDEDDETVEMKVKATEP